MILLVLLRSHALSPDERAALPEGAVALGADGEWVARLRIADPTPAALAAAAFALGRAVPDARLVLEEVVPTPDPAEPAAYDGDEPTAAGAAAAALRTTDPTAGEEAPWVGRVLDGAAWAEVRGLLQGTDPARVALGCRIARVAVARTAVPLLRRLLTHADTRVRRDAVEAIGALAGPALVPALRPLLNDPSPEVRGAAQAALVRLEGGAGAG